MSTIHELKCWPEFFDLMWSGEKTFEYRKNDRHFAVGDVLHLKKWCPRTARYLGEELWVRVTLLITSAPGLPRSYCIMGVVRKQMPENGESDAGGEQAAGEQYQSVDHGPRRHL